MPLSGSSDTLRLPLPADGEPGITLMPIRGESTSAIELGLVARQVVSPRAVLRVRALDHGRPVLSDFRCDLHRRGSARIRGGALDAAMAELAEDATTAELIPLALTELLAIEVDGAVLSLIPDDPTMVIAMANADDGEIARALARGDLDRLAVSWDALQRTVDERVDSVERRSLAEQRDALGCEAAARFPTTPIHPDLACD